jgi:hypothetical protein
VNGSGVLAIAAAPQFPDPAQAAQNRNLVSQKAVNSLKRLRPKRAEFHADRNTHLPVIRIVDRISRKSSPDSPNTFYASPKNCAKGPSSTRRFQFSHRQNLNGTMGSR